MSIDPAGQYASPYVGMGNNPTNRVDPDGGLDTKYENAVTGETVEVYDGIDRTLKVGEADFQKAVEYAKIFNPHVDGSYDGPRLFLSDLNKSAVEYQDFLSSTFWKSRVVPDMIDAYEYLFVYKSDLEDRFQYVRYGLGILDYAGPGGGKGLVTVGRWMSRKEYTMMQKTGKVLEGAGGKTSVAIGGSKAFPAASKGSVYAEFQVPANSLIQGGQSNWFSILGPNSSKSMMFMLEKQGGQLLPKIENLTPILEVK